MEKLLREAALVEIMPRYGKAKAMEKGDRRHFKDIVTAADLESSRYILAEIRKKFPGSYSEEQKFSDRFDYDLVWQIDPLDGTDEFCSKIIDGFAMHAALLVRQPNQKYAPKAGIIYIPGTDKLWSNDGSSSVRCTSRGKVLPIPKSNRDEIVGWVRKVDPDQKLREFYHKLGQELALPVRIMEGGGAGASISDLLEGKVNLIVMNYNYTKEWDLAMAEPIIRAAGGFICDLQGKEFSYNRPDVPGLGEPYNLQGYIISIAFKKEEILPLIPKNLLIDRLGMGKVLK